MTTPLNFSSSQLLRLNVVLLLLSTFIFDYSRGEEQRRRLQIYENIPAGTYIGRIEDDTAGGDSRTTATATTSSTRGVANYVLVYPPESQVEQTFSIDDRTGEIRTKIPLDFETRNSYVFLAIPSAGSKSTAITDGIRIQIDVLDVNDCPPEFAQRRIDLQLSEYAKIGTETPLPPAIDRDGSEKFGVQQYELIAGNINNAFRLGIRRLNRALYADLIVNSELDREILGAYALEIRASDGGQPPLNDTLLVNVTILDANDNSPVFDQARYVIKLTTNSTTRIGSEIVRVNAHDNDQGDNGVIDYRLLSSPREAQKYFAIDQTTGAITLAQSIDSVSRSSARTFELFVSARDRGYPQPLESTCFVSISIVDNDHNRPEMKIIYLSDDGRPSILESAQIGTLIARISVSDSDSPVVAVQQRSIQNRSRIRLVDDQDTFGIKESADDSSAVYLYLKKALDRELQSNYTVKLIGSISDSEKTEKLINLKIVDINDNAPKFLKTFYEAEIREKSLPGSSVVRVEAMDSDEGENAKITYSFLPSSDSRRYSNWFEIDSETGLITTADNLDCEISSKPELIVVASDGGKPAALSANVKVIVNVLDVNDNAPTFSQGVYNASLKEDAEIGYCFLKVEATDPDCGVNAQIHYKLGSDSSIPNPFQVDENTGSICLASKVDYELRRGYQFPVLAYDGGGLFGSTMITLNVEDTNDNAPIFYPTAYNVTIRTGANPGSSILIVSASDPDSGQYGAISYSITNGNEESKFRVDPKTGELFVATPLSLTIYQLSILATDGGGLISSQPAHVTILVTNEEDPCPRFDRSRYEFVVREDTLPGIAVGEIRATTGGGGESDGSITYSIYSGDPDQNFHIDPRTGSVSLLKYVDYETRRSQILNVQASMDRPVAAYNHTQIVIRVEDINDNAPVFERRSIKLIIPEDHPKQRSVFTCTATDLDDGKNGEVRYRLTNSNSEDAYFMIHPITGELRLTRELDYEKRKNFSLVVTAQDGGIPTMQDTMQVEIDVLDVNDHEPRFPMEEYRLVVSEDAAPMTRVLRVQATDQDSGPNGRITYRLELDDQDRRNRSRRQSGQVPGARAGPVGLLHSASAASSSQPATIVRNDPTQQEPSTIAARPSSSTNSAAAAFPFRIFSDNGWIYVRQALDRELRDEYRLFIVAKDNGQPPRSTRVPLLIQISDVNDHEPDCRTMPQLIASENRPPGTLVGRVHADDPDAGENGTVVYEMLQRAGGGAGHFRVTASGEIYTEVTLDRENEAVYDLTIVATDRGHPTPLSSQCALRIVVADENDQAPFFVLPLKDRLYFREEQPRGSEVAQIRASDSDQGENGTVRYYLEQSTPAPPFQIDAITGVLSSTEVLDYESGPKRFEISVLAEDMGKPPRSSRRTFLIEVIDIDDGGGVATDRSNQSALTFQVSESASLGYKIGYADSKMRDDSLYFEKKSIDGEKESSLEDSDSTLTNFYEIISGNGQGLFEIDRATSQLYVIKSLDYETSSSHFLVVNKIVQSKYFTSSVSPSSEIRIKILITDENDNSPVFNEDPVVFSVPENRAGYVVWQYNASDGDTGSFGRVEYRIVEQYPNDTMGIFELDATSGELSLKKELDFERITEYLLVVEAVDQAPNVSQRRSGRVTTRIYVTDVNDCEPRFISRDQAYAFVDEPAGYPMTYVTAVDDDWLENGRVTYRLIAGDQEAQFQLNATSGALLIAKPFKRDDAGREYRLSITAEDHGIPRRSSTQLLKLQILDVDDYSLRFEQSVYRVNVTENGPPGVVVAQLRAVGPPDGSGANTLKDLIYILPNGTAENRFRINEKTGALLTTKALDREEIDEYILTVYVRDSPHSARYDAATVIVNVEDMNDNIPAIGEGTCREQSVPENQPFDVLHTIIASDKDAGQNGKLSFAIIGGNVDGKFRINPNTGEIGCDALDRETMPTYNMTLQVRDNGSPSQSAQCILPITVLDVNDNPPRFAQSSYSAQIPENSPAGTTVLKLTATDADQGLNGKIMYSITNETAGLFDVGANTGEIVVLGRLDFEKENSYTFLVKAYDQGPSESRWDTVRVTIQILDANDNAPVFPNVPFIANVSTNMAAGQRLVKVVATDMDGPGPNSEVSYSLTNADDRFVINPSTGVISAKRNLQLPSGSVEYLNVMASDRGEPPKSSQSVVEVVVDSSEDAYRRSAIKFSRPTYKVQIPEDTLAGTRIIEVVATSPNRGAAQIEYRIIGGNESGAFNIDGNKGTIILGDSTHIDYESIKSYQLIVEAKTRAQNQGDIQRAYVSVRIDITDSNDHEPQFLQQSYSAVVSEGRPRNTFVIQVSATDGDIGENAALTYSIVSGNVDSAFVVDNGGLVKTNAELDREIHDRYTLTVMAVDAGSPPKSGTAVIDVLVMDVNDNSPSFPTVRPIKISESTEAGTLLTTMTANDVDTFPPLVYSLTPSNASQYFNLDRFSGRLVLAKSLDYESEREMELEVQVSDSIYVTSARQKIIIVDENDNWPVFSQSFYQAALPTGARAGTPIIRVAATDLDSGTNGRLQYGIAGTAPESAGFWMNAETGELFLNRTLGNQTVFPPLVQLTIMAVDAGQPPRTAVTTVQIQMGYVSEQQIEFASKSYSFSIPEDAPVHSIVGRVSTTASGDSAKHWKHVIRTIDQQRTFDIDSDGNVILMRRLDRESIDSYSLELGLVRSQGGAPSNASCRVIIQVDDINDNYPQFDRSEYSTAIKESLQPGTILLKLNAFDPDYGANGSVIYELMSGGLDDSYEHAAIDVDHSTGAVILRRSILGRFVSIDELRLIVRASDCGRPSRTTIVGVLIRIERENTSAPIFPVRNYIGWVAENAPAGTLVLKVRATTLAAALASESADEPAAFTYSIQTVDGESGDQFKVDPTTGELRTSAILDYEQTTAYRLSVIATDRAGRRADTGARVLIRGVDEYAPQFAQSTFQFQTSYSAPEGEILGAIYATDRDHGSPDGRVSFVFKESTDQFRIDPRTGVITVRGSLESLREQQQSSSAERLAGESNSSPMKDVKSVYLTVVAYSGPDPINGRSNSTTLEIQIGRFTKSSQILKASSTMIIGISVALVLLVVLILIVVVLKLRRNDHQKSTTTSSNRKKSTVIANKSKKNRQLIKSHDVIQPCAKAAQRAAAGFRTSTANGEGDESDGSLRIVRRGQSDDVDHQSSTIGGQSTQLANGQRSHADPLFGRDPYYRHSPSVVNGHCHVPSVNSTTHSSGRGSSLDDQPDARGRSRQGRRGTTADSGLNMTHEEDDRASIDLPNTLEYLTSLGVEAPPASAIVSNSPHKRPGGGWQDRSGQYSEAPTDENADVQDLIYSKINEVLSSDASIDRAGRNIGARRPSIDENLVADYGRGSIMTSTDPTTVAAGQGGWPTSTPSYQPLTQVFSEIAKIKSDQDTLRRKKESATMAHESLPRRAPDTLRVDNGHHRDRNGSTLDSTADRSPSTWASTGFASPAAEEPNYGAYAISDARFVADGPGESELEIKI